MQSAGGDCDPKRKLNGREESRECTAGICRTETEEGEDQGEPCDEEQGVEHRRLAAPERGEAAEICGNEREHARREEAEDTSEERTQ